MYNIIQKYIAINRPFKKLKPLGVVIHETANPGATDENHFKYFNSGYRGASAHAFVDWDSITQTIPWNEIAWHAGRTANKKFIGIELCHPKTHDEVKFKEVWSRGVWLTAYVFTNILKINKVTKDNILSHYDISLKWKETTHVDPIGYFKEYGKSMDNFRNDVQTEIDKMLKITKSTSYKRGIVTASVLNVRDAPSLKGKIIGKLIKGARVTIYDEKNGWYLLDNKRNKWSYSKYIKIIS